MKAAIDSAGRVVVPKAIRDELRLLPGSELTIRIRDGALVLEPEPTQVALVRRGRVVVAKPKEPLPKMTQDDVRDVLERARR
jgi:AbrB family looped-hinge helix DNA binding protein